LGMIALLNQYEDFEVVLASSNGKELLERLKTVTPDVLLLDIEMSIMDGRETFDKLKVKFPDLKTIMLTEHFSDPYIIYFMKNGAASFLSKNNRIEKVVDTIRRVHVDGKCYDNIIANILAGSSSTGMPEKPLRDRPDLNLTIREIEIIRLMCMGKDNKDIMELLHIEVRTIETHRRSIWKKTCCKNTVELIDFAFKQNLISF